MRRFVRSYLGLVLLFLAFTLGVLGTYSWLQTNFFIPLNKEEVGERLFVVQQRDNLKTISTRLEKQGFVRKWWNVYYLNVIKADERVGRILPGEYQLSAALGPREILERILSGKVYYRTVTIAEGKTSREIAKLVAETGLVTFEQMIEALNSPQLMYNTGITTGSFEGYLFPETYNFTRPTDDAESVIKRMVDEGRKRIKNEIPNFEEKAIEIGLNPQRVIILASVVEKETGKPEERGLVASVFHNRLRIGMPLQSDPTVIYGIEDFNGRLTKENLKDKSNPYNTYVHPDLPPTPICNPGIEAIKAVLEPTDSEYLYFVSKNDGTHHFSTNYREHRNAVNQYQRNGGS